MFYYIQESQEVKHSSSMVKQESISYFAQIRTTSKVFSFAPSVKV